MIDVITFTLVNIGYLVIIFGLLCYLFRESIKHHNLRFDVWYFLVYCKKHRQYPSDIVKRLEKHFDE